MEKIRVNGIHLYSDYQSNIFLAELAPGSRWVRLFDYLEHEIDLIKCIKINKNDGTYIVGFNGSKSSILQSALLPIFIHVFISHPLLESVLFISIP